MKILKGNYGECRFCDNMDPDHGLPSLEEKSWDLCLTDPPYGYKIQDNKGMIGGSNLAKNKEYPITKNDIFTIDQFNECKKLSNEQIIWGMNHYDFLPITTSVIVWDKKKKNGWHNDFGDGELAWGSFKTSIRIFRYRWMGCLREKDAEKRDHPFQKPVALWKWIIGLYKPKTILDPFLGSGTTAEVCESLGIPWLGFEIMEEYAPGIEKRIKRGIKKKSQQSLNAFVKPKSDLIVQEEPFSLLD
jgi:DNA modification methylase